MLSIAWQKTDVSRLRRGFCPRGRSRAVTTHHYIIGGNNLQSFVCKRTLQINRLSCAALTAPVEKGGVFGEGFVLPEPLPIFTLELTWRFCGWFGAAGYPLGVPPGYINFGRCRPHSGRQRPKARVAREVQPPSRSHRVSPIYERLNWVLRGAIPSAIMTSASLGLAGTEHAAAAKQEARVR